MNIIFDLFGVSLQNIHFNELSTPQLSITNYHIKEQYRWQCKHHQLFSEFTDRIS